MTRRTSVSRAVRETARRALALLLGVLLLFAAFSFIASKPAYAESSSTWHFVGARTYTKAPDPKNVTYEYSDNMVSAEVHIGFKDNWWVEQGDMLSWNERLTWNTPPKEIPVGSESDVFLKFEGSYSDWSAPEDFKLGYWYYFYENGEERSITHLQGMDTPLREPSGFIEYFSFDPEEFTISNLFTRFADNYNDFGEPGFRDYGASIYGAENANAKITVNRVYMAWSDDPDEHWKVNTDEPSGKVVRSQHVTQDAVAQRVTEAEGKTQAMAIVVYYSFPGNQNLGSVVNVYLYTNTPAQADVVSNIEPTSVLGEFGKAIIPIAIIGGVAGGAVVLSRKRKKGTKNTFDDSKNEKPSSTFLMVLKKDVGDTLQNGSEPVEVCARIEEHVDNPGGGVTVRRRDDLTQRITAKAGQNMQVVATEFRSPYRVARVKAQRTEASLLLDASQPYDPNKAVVTFTFRGDGANFISNVAFKLCGPPAIAFIVPNTGDVSSRGHAELDLLIGDEEGVELCFEAQEFASPIDVKDVATTFNDVSIYSSCEPHTSEKRPDAKQFKVLVMNSLTSDSPYGWWPLERRLSIVASNGQGEKAEATVNIKLWPKGFFYGALRGVQPENVKKDRIVVDTSLRRAAETSHGEDIVIDSVPVCLGVASKDTRGRVSVGAPRPGVPNDGADFIRLIAPQGDAESGILLDWDKPKFWYNLEFKEKPLSEEVDQRLSVLVMEPLIPLAVEKKGWEYTGIVGLKFDCDGKRLEDTITFGLTGIVKAEADATREEEIENIRTLYRSFGMHNIDRVNKVLLRYGPAAEKARAKFGEPGPIKSLETSSLALLRSIEEVQDPERLKLMRQELWDSYWEFQNGVTESELTWAEWMDVGYRTAMAVRWADDVAFSFWWYLMFKEAGTVVEPMVTPIKEIFLEYCAQLGDLYLDSSKKVVNPLDYCCDFERVSNALLQGMENSMFNLLVTGMLDGGTMQLTRKQYFEVFGLISAFVFAKNCAKYSEYDPYSGAAQVHLWKALKGTMSDLTVQTLKLIVTVVVARTLRRIFELLPSGGLDLNHKNILTTNVSESKLADSFRTMMTKEGRAEYFGLLRMRNKDPFSFSDFYRSTWGDPVVDGKLAEAADREAMSALEYMYCLIAGKFVDVSYEKGAEAVNESLNMEAELDSFVRSFGHFDVTMPDDDGNPVVVQVPFVAGVFVYVNKALRALGIDGMHVDLGEVMPENVPYENRKAIIKRLNGIPGAKYEIEFLRPRYEEKFDDVFPVGAEKPTFDKGTDWHRYAR